MTDAPPGQPTFADVARAAERIAGVAHRTPVLTSRTADERAGASLFFKAENLQRAGAFKFRGAYNAIAALAGDARARGVIAYSSGNHAQAIALASRLLNVPATIVMPQDAPAMKVAATQGYGAEVVRYDRYTQDRVALGRELAEARGLTLIPPYDHPDVIAGQGTLALELIAETGPLDMLVVCLGGGGMLSGCALVAAERSPGCAVIGVEPEAGNDGQRSLREGRIVTIPVPRTIADGAQTTFLGSLTFPIIQERVADIVTVTDAELVATMRFFAERMKLVVEPTGCLAAAAVMHSRLDVRGRRVGVVISGGNIDLASFARHVAG
ncbi:threo-3-hydroxy-L-aspartate ammonia-lyase [Methylobacterium sp. WL30]|uniref:threo-3-hydroxy-L-aspartate ammonia-lyase n=3 Tax=Methylobacterium TaxID=407 RepID=UPI0011CC7E0A|nr:MULTISPECIES: threo-3-hydroxy-L-aspartate ammonia-lyase [unclassified Methylobacterium]TXN51130.1 threo-3-hydroxy-L-aspartate ammonia-lyase [Methylobacterium sp. WL119]TXN69875.1 threo-3-hydroxy-L-aspartate ammonia-lyase [Methylobacterium sp. WL30]